MFVSDLVHAECWAPCRGGVAVSLWRHGRPTAARIGQMLAAAPGCRNHERIERIGAWEKIIAWAQAHQCDEIARFVDDAAAEAATERRGFTFEDAIASAEAEIALVLHTTTRAAGCRADDARELRHRFPATMTALLDGRITLSQARAIIDGGIDLNDEQALAMERQVLGRAGRQTLGQLRESVRRAATNVDPEAAERRHQRKRRERKVVLYPERDGMATLAATLPAAEAVGVYAVLDQHARACGRGDERPMDARRADTLVDLVLGETGFLSVGTAGSGSGPSDDARRDDEDNSADPAADAKADPKTGAGAGAGATADAKADPARMPTLVPHQRPSSTARLQVQIRVTVPMDVLTGHSDACAELAGYGPVPASVARELAADPDSIWHRLVTDPLSGALLDHGTTRYRPPPALSEFVIARHQTCQFPGCRTPAHRCDLDHNVPFDAEADVGPTSSANLGRNAAPTTGSRACPAGRYASTATAPSYGGHPAGTPTPFNRRPSPRLRPFHHAGRRRHPCAVLRPGARVEDQAPALGRTVDGDYRPCPNPRPTTPRWFSIV